MLSWCSLLLSVSSANLDWQVTIYSRFFYSLGISSTAALDNVVLIHLKESHDTAAEAGSGLPTFLSSLRNFHSVEFCCSKVSNPRKGFSLLYQWAGKERRGTEIWVGFPTSGQPEK